MKSRVPLRALTSDELRKLDLAAEQLGLPTIVLMENAGRGAAEILIREMSRHQPTEQSTDTLLHVLIVCGPGNNGGDGAVVARHLDALGLASVEVIWISPADALRGLAPVQHRILENSGMRQHHIEDIRELDQPIEKADWIVDGLFGTGLTRPIESQTLAGQVINKINQSGKPILALDIPSGLDANTGSSLGVAIKALLTASFVAAKIGYENPTSKAWTGYVEVVDIGLPRKLLSVYEQKKWLLK